MTLRRIAEICAGEYGVGVDEVYGVSRRRPVAECRHMTVFFAYKWAAMTCMAIARLMGKSHVSVMYSVHMVEDRLGIGYTPQFDEHYRNILKRIEDEDI